MENNKETSFYFCLKLKERYKEYNKENNTHIGFAQYLRVLQYSKSDISSIFEALYRASRRSLYLKRLKNEVGKNRSI